MKKCKSCQSDIADKAIKCKNCGADQRNWFLRHKILTALALLIMLGIVFSGTSDKDTSNSNTSGSNPSNNQQEKSYRFDDRADKQPKDVEITPGESGTIDGRKLTVVSVERLSSLGEFNKADDGKVFVVVSVTIENTSDSAKTYNVFDFRIQTAGGQVLDPDYGSDNDLQSGDLVPGGKVSGKVVFEVPVETSTQYIIYKPNGAISDRIIVEAKQ